MRVLFWVQHLLGIGHVRRAELIARALVEAGLKVTVAQGGFPVAGVGFGGAVVAALPPARVRDAHFSPLLGAGDRPVDDAWRTRRQAALLALAREVRPQIVLLETYPLGRRAFAFELDPLVALCRALPECRLVAASVRDILVRKAKPEKERQMAAAARRLVDLVLVHGDPAILPLEASFPAAAEIADLLRYTGFVAPGRQLAKPPGGAGEGEIVVSVGGGAVGFELLRTAIDAARLLGEAGPPWRLLVGPDIAPDGMAALAAHAGGVSRVTVERARPDFPALLDRAALSVSQAGYNTVMDLLAAGCRAILVPFARGGESEQSDRATLLAARGLATVLPETGLAADRLAHAVTEALDRPRPGPVAGLALDGARESARILIAEAARRDR